MFDNVIIICRCWLVSPH